MKIQHMAIFAAFFPSLGFSQENLADVKRGLDQIRTAIDSKQSLSENPLAAFDLASFTSRGYLFYYRGLAQRLIAEKENGEKKLASLESALVDLKHALHSMPSADFLKEALFATYKDVIETAFALKRYFTVLNAIDKLPEQDLSTPRWVFYYAQSLFETHQTTAFLRLVKQYPSLFRNEGSILQHLPQPPSWQRLIIIALEDERISIPRPKETPSSLPFDQESMLDKTRAAMDYLKKHPFFSVAEKTFNVALSLYDSLSTKVSLSSQEHRFAGEFEKAMPTFAPQWVEILIDKLWKRQKLKEAEQLSLAFLKRYNGHPSVPKVLFNLGRIQEDASDYREAIKSFRKFLDLSDEQPLRELAQFRIAWTSYLAKHGQAAERFASYLREYPGGRYASTCEYFNLQLARKEKAEGEVRSLAQTFTEKHPLNFYTLMVLDEWGISEDVLLTRLSHRPFYQETAYQQFRANIKTLSKLRIYKELRAFDLQEDAWKLLMTFPFDEGNETFMLYLTAEFNGLQFDHGQALSMARLLGSFPHLRAKLTWQGLFPAYRLDLIRNVLTEQSSALSAFMVLAIIRQESAFNPDARSPAQAYGLMQLIEPTARRTAGSLGLNDFDLLKAKDNLALGIKTFSDLLEIFDHRLDYALSAYNAGEAVTRHWIKLRGHLSPIEFVESIPYQETRNYIKNVLRNYAIYQLLYEKRPTPLVAFEYKGKELGAN
ncbi:MAG: transglycosylase SLT domain-containing protein [Deltaproteobacteria bacterium]|nr:transglycosylase SLT domain-containing protein [Deltaproteobacteria bacterium]